MDFAEIGQIILPVFGLIGIGFLCGRLGLLRDVVGDGLADFVYVVAVPVLVFRTIGTAHFPDISPWPLWFAYFGGVVVAWALGSVVATRLFGRSRAEGVIAGVAASFSNTVMVGIPLVLTAFGEAGAVPLFMIISVHLPVMMVAGTLMTERAVRLDAGNADPLNLPLLARRIALNLVTNPLVIALAAGALWRMLGLPFQGVPKSIVDQIAATAIPCSLFSLGLGLKRYGLFGEIRLAGAITLLKLVAMPVVVFALARWVFALPPLWVAVATVTAGSSCGINAFLFAVRFGVAQATASNTIGLSTAASIVSIAFWLDLVGHQM